MQLSLGSSSDLKDAAKVNGLIQSYNMLFIPIMAKLLTRFYPDPVMRDGLLVLACLPPTINMCISQTQAAGGNMATAIFNAVLGKAYMHESQPLCLLGVVTVSLSLY